MQTLFFIQESNPRISQRNTYFMFFGLPYFKTDYNTFSIILTVIDMKSYIKMCYAQTDKLH